MERRSCTTPLLNDRPENFKSSSEWCAEMTEEQVFGHFQGNASVFQHHPIIPSMM
jgi:hypothetical protein